MKDLGEGRREEKDGHSAAHNSQHTGHFLLVRLMARVEEDRGEYEDDETELPEEQLLVRGEHKEGDHVGEEQGGAHQIHHSHGLLLGQEAVLQPQGATGNETVIVNDLVTVGCVDSVDKVIDRGPFTYVDILTIRDR